MTAVPDTNDCNRALLIDDATAFVNYGWYIIDSSTFSDEP